MTILLNGEPVAVAPDTTVADLLDADPRGCAVAVNGEVVPRERHAATPVADGDTVEIVRAVQGG
ncbi:sulfur carrier protein ThiS [Nocardioides speluncae]|uniref:sulfur carrier protein ThiS n=1 Tax=Nocardioides speluncae TaxID=2670337 RepID=UPI000D6941B4|nr:sulfur carrier protein ThiS [Nocardioides speluncae]